MPVINNPFNGKMNLDVADYRIDNGDYIDALNITKDAQGVGQDRVVSNILGNTNIPFSLNSGTNKVIGFYSDKVRNRAYYFVWNSNGYNSILYYDMNINEVKKVLISKTDSDGIDILNFNPSYKVTSVNIFYRDDEGDLLFFNDGTNPPKYINVAENHGTSWKLEYILVAKAPPIMPPKVVYENDTTVTINNLRNRLFQFSYRYVYLNNEKSVWSSKSIVPLPQQDTLLLTDDLLFTNNSRISVSVSTGGLDVKAIEIAFRETSNGFTSDWFLIKLFNKLELSIQSNSIYTYNFYNDSLYAQIDILETTQLQDWVPQKANASELANGNVLLYSGITESYNKTAMNLIAKNRSYDTVGYFFDYCGLLFFATCNGTDSGSTGTELKVYLFGTGTNTSNIVSTLNNANTEFVINAINNTGSDIGITFVSYYQTETVSNILNGISSALIAKGWSSPTIVNNVLTISYTNGFTLYSSGNIKITTTDNTTFANSWNSGYAYALQYFDSEGRTIGAQTNIEATLNTPISDSTWYPSTYLEIHNRPPLEAVYYQVLRSDNITYNKRLFWITRGAYCSTSQNTTVQRFAYLDISNIEDYNLQITSTQGVVSYNYVQGDRITFLARYDANNNRTSINQQYDYEILGTESTIVLENGTKKVGNFIKILYPDVANTDPNFSFGALPLPTGTTAEDFLHYQIFLYNYRSNSATTERFFYEFGKCFGIGNPGTNLAYHIGLEQTQSATNPETTPAIVSMTNGDLFFRKRKVPYNDNYTFTSGATSQDINSLMQINVIPTTPITNSTYVIKTQVFNNNLPANYPTYSSTNWFFNNLLSTQSLVVKLAAEFSVYQSQANDNTNFNFRAIVITSTTSTLIDLFPTQIVQSQVQTTFVLDNIISIPPGAKVWIASYSSNIQSGETFTINPFNLTFQVLKNSTISIIESSFIDTYNLVTNSNGRASIVDVNAKKTYFPTLIRFGGAYQIDTNINQLNNFKFENFDEYDRSFGDVIRLHVRDRYLKVYQKFKVGNVPILTQIVKDSANNPLQANTDTLINKIQYYAGDYGIGDAATSLAWNNFADYFVDNYRGVVCRLSQDGITPISITNQMNAFFTAKLSAYRQELNNGYSPDIYTGNPCIYGVFDAYTNKYIIAMEEINRYQIPTTTTTTTIAPTTTSTTTSAPTTTTTTTISPTTTTTTTIPPTTTTTTIPPLYTYRGNSVIDGTNALDACSRYASVSDYNSFKSSLASITVGDVFYTTYPARWNGDSQWVALKSGGVGDAYSFQVSISGVVMTVGGNCTTPTTTTTTTTTAAPTTTTTTTAAPTTTTTSTTTTTTTLALVFFRLYECATGNFIWTTPYTIGTFATNTRVVTDSGARTCVIDGTISYSNPGGTLYSVTATAGTGCPATTTTTTTTTTTLAPTTTTTTQPPISNGFIATCTGTTQTITINAFSGGDGTNYYANDTTYVDAISAQSGPTSLVTSGFRTYTNQPSGTRYVFIYSGSRNTVTSGGQACTTTTTTTTAAPTTTTTTSTTTTTTTLAPLTYLFDAVAAALACDAGTSVAVYGLGTSAGDTQFIAGHTYYYVDRVLLNVSGFGNPTGNYWMDSSGNAWVITNGVPISSLAC